MRLDTEGEQCTQPAVMLTVFRMDCCTSSLPACGGHVAQALLYRMLHLEVACPEHGTISCYHLVLELRPL